MYPFLRLGLDLWLHRARPLDVLGTHVTTHRIRPLDLDMFGELNNGRTLTLFDISRVTLAARIGLARTLRAQRWGLTLAGGSVRYRRRVRAFDKVEVRVRSVGWDERFMYLEHGMYRSGDCTSHLLMRAAVTDASGIVGTDRVLVAMGLDAVSPSLPDWVAAWVAADAARPWPPKIDGS